LLHLVGSSILLYLKNYVLMFYLYVKKYVA